MIIEVLKSKIHRVSVTDANLNYVGSITIDEDLMDAANIIEFEKVSVVNNNNGERFETYVIKGEPDSGSNRRLSTRIRRPTCWSSSQETCNTQDCLPGWGWSWVFF